MGKESVIVAEGNFKDDESCKNDFDLTSLKETLNEIRLVYQQEYDRFGRIESKVSYLLILNTAIFTIINTVSVENFLIFLPTNLFLIISIFFSFRVFDSRMVMIPHREKPRDFFRYAKNKPNDLIDLFLREYLTPTENIREINLEKLKNQNLVILSTKLVIVVFVANLIILYIL